MAAGDSWLAEYDACAQLGQEVMEKINERGRQQKNSANYAKLSAQIRSSMKDFSSESGRLKQQLIRASSSYHITQREVERRQVMLDNLMTKEKQLDEASRNDREDMGGRSQLLSRGSAGLSHDPWGAAEEPEDLQGLSFGDIRQQQQSVIREQDQGLEALSHVLSRQKQMALDIGDEVETQNEIIDDITDHTDTTTQRLLRETRHIKIVDKKSNTCGYWVVIVLLIVAIITVIAIPFHGKP